MNKGFWLEAFRKSGASLSPKLDWLWSDQAQQPLVTCLLHTYNYMVKNPDKLTLPNKTAVALWFQNTAQEHDARVLQDTSRKRWDDIITTIMFTILVMFVTGILCLVVLRK